jgi:aspartate aminotransferase
VFLFNNPSNPTGMVYTRDEIARLAEVLAKHPDTWIVTDDIYNRMVFDGVATTISCSSVPNCASA